MGTMALQPEQKQTFESLLIPPAAHPLIDDVVPLFSLPADTFGDTIYADNQEADIQQRMWRRGELGAQHDFERLSICLAETALSISIDHHHSFPELSIAGNSAAAFQRATFILDGHHPKLYVSDGVHTPIVPSAENDRAVGWFIPVFAHSLASLGLQRFIDQSQHYQQAS